MASDFSSGRVKALSDFGFAFNDKNFSDRVLRIEIVSDDFYTMKVFPEFDAVSELCGNRKRRREDIKIHNGKKNGPILCYYYAFFMWVCVDVYEAHNFVILCVYKP